ncbi:MAG: SoxR reducing system RseC family protein [Lachnospiraceae bacterium]|nr:SoxR reducing system RseC family protein [Lachnospiraceae bacterium]
MAEKGIVTGIKNDLVVIKMTRTEACAKCRACIAGMSEKEMIMEADNQCNAQVGDWVELELTENGFFFAVMIMYGIPLLAFLAGILLSYFVIMPRFMPLTNPDLPSFLIGLVFTGVAYLWIRSQEHRWEAKKYRPIAARITSPDPDLM